MGVLHFVFHLETPSSPYYIAYLLRSVRRRIW